MTERTNTPAACYRKLRKYKYQLMEKYHIKVETGLVEEEVTTDFLHITPTGDLTIHKAYSWDGPSGPTIDTQSFMRGSLVHDALYQLMRLGHMAYTDHREYADDLLKEMCLKDGMWPFRAWYVHLGVRMFGEKHARPRKEVQNERLYAP